MTRTLRQRLADADALADRTPFTRMPWIFRGAFILLFAFTPNHVNHPLPQDQRLVIAFALLAGLVIGVVYQTAHPRDLTERLLVIAWFVPATVILFLVPSDISIEPYHVALLLGTVAGFVLGEVARRRRGAPRRGGEATAALADSEPL